MLNKHLIDFSTHIGLLLKNVRNSLCDIQTQEVFFLFYFFFPQRKAHTCQTPVSGIPVSLAHFNLLWETKWQEVQVFHRAGGNFSQPS